MDSLLKVLALEDRVRVYIVNNTETTNEAIERHDLWPSAASVLGKTMAIAQMMGAMLISLHNITYLNKLMSDIREAIMQDSFTEFREEFYKKTGKTYKRY